MPQREMDRRIAAAQRHVTTVTVRRRFDVHARRVVWRVRSMNGVRDTTVEGVVRDNAMIRLSPPVASVQPANPYQRMLRARQRGAQACAA